MRCLDTVWNLCTEFAYIKSFLRYQLEVPRDHEGHASSCFRCQNIAKPWWGGGGRERGKSWRGSVGELMAGQWAVGEPLILFGAAETRRGGIDQATSYNQRVMG